MIRLLLVRHSSVQIEANHCYGQLNIAAQPQALLEAHDKLQAQLSPYMIDQVLCSPLQRCRQLASALGIAPTVKYVNAIQEINFGQWEGQNWDDIPRSELQAWADNLEHFRLGNDGETVAEFHLRVRAFFANLCQNDRLQSQSTEQTILCISHAGVIRSIIGQVEGMSTEQSMSLPVSMGSLSCIRIETNSSILEYIND